MNYGANHLHNKVGSNKARGAAVGGGFVGGMAVTAQTVGRAAEQFAYPELAVIPGGGLVMAAAAV